MGVASMVRRMPAGTLAPMATAFSLGPQLRARKIAISRGLHCAWKGASLSISLVGWAMPSLATLWYVVFPMMMSTPISFLAMLLLPVWVWMSAAFYACCRLQSGQLQLSSTTRGRRLALSPWANGNPHSVHPASFFRRR